MAETMLDLIKAFKAARGYDDRPMKRLADALRITGPVFVGPSIWSYSEEGGGSIQSSSAIAVAEYGTVEGPDGYALVDMTRIPPEDELSEVYGIATAARTPAPPIGTPVPTGERTDGRVNVSVERRSPGDRPPGAVAVDTE